MGGRPTDPGVGSHPDPAAGDQHPRRNRARGHTPWTRSIGGSKPRSRPRCAGPAVSPSTGCETAQQLTGRLPGALDALTAGAAHLPARRDDLRGDSHPHRPAGPPGGASGCCPKRPGKRSAGCAAGSAKPACSSTRPPANERAQRAATERSVTIRPLTGRARAAARGRTRRSDPGNSRTLDDTADRHPTAIRAPTPPAGSTPSSTSSSPADGASPLHQHRKHRQSRRRRRAHDSTDSTKNAGTAGPAAAAGCPPPRKIPILAQITMDLPTLLGRCRTTRPNYPGYRPLPAAFARAFAANADWQRFVQDPITGAPQDLGRTRRHPDADLRRWIIARDRTCLFPECYRPAADCEPDHNPAWEHHGGTDKDHLHQLCPKHHKVLPSRLAIPAASRPDHLDQPTRPNLPTASHRSRPDRPRRHPPTPRTEFDDTIRPATNEDQQITTSYRETATTARSTNSSPRRRNPLGHRRNLPPRRHRQPLEPRHRPHRRRLRLRPDPRRRTSPPRRQSHLHLGKCSTHRPRQHHRPSPHRKSPTQTTNTLSTPRRPTTVLMRQPHAGAPLRS